MNKRINQLWLEALSGSRTAYRRLGLHFLRRRLSITSRRLAALCLLKAAQMGDEKAYWLYHRAYAEEAPIIDKKSCRDIYRDYQNTADQQEKLRLARYLRLAAGGQKESGK